MPNNFEKENVLITSFVCQARRGSRHDSWSTYLTQTLNCWEADRRVGMSRELTVHATVSPRGSASASRIQASRHINRDQCCQTAQPILNFNAYISRLYQYLVLEDFSTLVKVNEKFRLGANLDRFLVSGGQWYEYFVKDHSKKGTSEPKCIHGFGWQDGEGRSCLYVRMILACLILPTPLFLLLTK